MMVAECDNGITFTQFVDLLVETQAELQKATNKRVAQLFLHKLKGAAGILGQRSYLNFPDSEQRQGW